uniref:MIT domain-containing protein n=1 Tax=Alexandrium andersonii TaxID=327968 RepID=A0A7S2GVI2_9DINO|mmetsp:Transcript_64306/g.144577  ORF Transcript_64306/g.144577 Transcript_64306/m.144577 type:complete len:110 (+) Transcript_64306:2-331(+)
MPHPDSKPARRGGALEMAATAAGEKELQAQELLKSGNIRQAIEKYAECLSDVLMALDSCSSGHERYRDLKDAKAGIESNIASLRSFLPYEYFIEAGKGGGGRPGRRDSR